MLYNDYYRRMSKVMAFARAVKKHLLIILLSIFAVVAVTATLLATRGLVYDKDDCPAQVEYGQSIGYSAGAFLAGDVKYEYRAENSTEWTSTPPTRAGKYYVRAVSSRTGGSPSYGNVHAVTIQPKKIDVNVGNTTVFGENPSVTAALSYGDTIECTDFIYADQSSNATTVKAVDGSVVIKDKNGEDVTYCYDIATPICPIVFTPRKIGVTVADRTAEYDNTPKAFGGYELTDGTLADGNMLVCVSGTTLTEVGEVSVDPEFRVLGADGVDVSANYDIKRNTGKISVTQRIVYVTSGSGESVYNGNSFSCADYEISGNTSLVSGHRLSLELHSSLTDAGHCENMMAFKVYDGDRDITSNYSIVLTAGELTVTPRPITVKSVDKSWEYDGKQHSEAAVLGTIGLLEEKGHRVVVDAESAVIIDAGTADNDITVTVQTADGTDVSANYNIAYNPGTLTVTRKQIEVKAAGDQFVYDGTAKSKNEIESVTGLVDGHTASASTADGAYATITDAGDMLNTITVIVSDGNGVDKSDNYTVRLSEGLLRVKPRPITVKSTDGSREYDGTPFTFGGYEITSENKLVLSHTGVATCSGEITNVGTVENPVADFKVFDGETDVTKNYSVGFDATSGTLTVTPRDVTVTSVDGQFVYDGTPQSKNEILSIDRLVDGHTASAVDSIGAYATITDVGTANNDILICIADGNGIDRTGNYRIAHVPGTLEMKPRPVTVKSTDRTKIYDATPLKGGSNDFEVLEGSFVLDHIGAAIYTEGRTDKGESDNAMDELRVLSGETDVTKNYAVTISDEKGKLTVTPRPIKVIAVDKDKEFVYDGTQHGYTECTIVPVSPLGEDAQTIVGGQTAQIIPHTQLRDVKFDEQGNVIGVDNVLELFIKDGTLYVSYNYQIEYDLGTITITPRPITVKAAWATKIYDGTPLTSDSFAVTSELKIVEGQRGVATCNGSITEVGTTTNTIEHNFKVYDGEADVTANYDITYDDTPNPLTVEARPITVTTQSHTFTYDGEDHDWKYFKVAPTQPRLEATDVAIISAHHAEVDESDVTTVNEVTLPDSGGVSGVPNRFHVFVLDENGEDKTRNYDITYIYQRIWVRPRPIRVYTESQEFLYDNNDHSHVVYTMAYLLATDGDDKPIIDKHIDEVVSFTTVHDVMREDDGSYYKGDVIGTDNNIEIAIKDKTTSADVTYNYDIFYVYGELVVNPRPITVTSATNEFMYDGELHGDNNYVISNREPLKDTDQGVLNEHEHNVRSWLTFAAVKRDSNNNVTSYENSVVIRISDRSNGVNQNQNYDIKYVYGTITINPRPIEITTGSHSWIFDGIYHNNIDFSVKALFTLKDGESALVKGHKVALVNKPVAVRDVKRDRNGNVIGYENNSALKIVHESYNIAMTNNYEITYVYGTLTITPRHITIRSGREEFIDGVNSWVYDGDWHEDRYAEIVDTVCDDAPPEELEQTGLVEGHELVCIFTGAQEVNRDSDDYSYINKVFVISIRPVGSSSTLEVDLRNYEIHYIYGKLRILPRPITIYTSDHVWAYDGQPHSDYRVIVDETTPLANGGRIVNDESSVCEITDIGKKQNKFDIVIYGLYDQEDELVYVATDCYDITYVYGELEIVEGEGGGDNGEHSGNIGGGGLGGGEGEGDGEDPIVMFTISTNYDGHIYLRQNSYGDYVLGGEVSFLDAEAYNGFITVDGNRYGMNYLPTTVLQNSKPKYYINIELADKGFFVVPYFAALGDDQIQTSDVWYYLRGDELGYTLNFYPYMYVSDNGAALGGGVNRTLSSMEHDYYNYVLSKYLQIPDSTKSYLDGIIAAQNFSVGDADIISKVAQYIKNSANYNLKYNTKLDKENDIVVEFLRKYKEGVCRHYAAAATMLFRALGIPARYVCGVSANGDGTGNPIEVTSDKAHAWTEVYIAGVGWVPVEVTGGTDMGGGNGGGGSGEGEGEVGDFLPSLTIKPIDVYVDRAPAKPINAVIQTAGNIDLNYLISNKGYYYNVVVEETAPGVSEIKSFTLYNHLGMNVTNEFGDRLTFLPGKLVVTGRTLISVELPCLGQTYNGTALKFEPDDYIVLDAPDGFTVTLDLSKIIVTDVCVITTEDFRVMLDNEYGKDKWYTVLDANGNNVTSEYFISFIGDVTDDTVAEDLKNDTSGMTILQISRRRIVFTSLSKSKKYDGTPLEAEITYVQSQLVSGHKAIFTETVSITDIGEVQSTFIVQIVDADGVDVTDNYLIEKVVGVLTVTE